MAVEKSSHLNDRGTRLSLTLNSGFYLFDTVLNRYMVTQVRKSSMAGSDWQPCHYIEDCWHDNVMDF